MTTVVQEVVPAVDTMEKNLQDCLFIFSNKLLPDSQVIGKPVETDNKRIKGKSKTEVLDTSLEVEEQEVITTDLLFTGMSRDYRTERRTVSFILQTRSVRLRRRPGRRRRG